MESGRSRLMFSSLAVTTQMLKILADDVNLGLLSIGGGAGWLAFDVLKIYIYSHRRKNGMVCICK